MIGENHTVTLNNEGLHIDGVKLEKGNVFVVNERGKIEVFNQQAALIFIQEKVGGMRGNIKVYQDGAEVQGIRSINISAHVDDVTTHTIEYITGCTKKK
ncbi:hypothetical protein ACPV3A_16470 [Paenibacillus sp. Dod16]|uniref:hypothetical protein n=1 Tax=Paenibacillus sp. Dod16 TaxID=3416392 RepID=UPI003CF90785